MGFRQIRRLKGDKIQSIIDALLLLFLAARRRLPEACVDVSISTERKIAE